MSEKKVAKHIDAKKVKNSGRGIKKGDMLKGNVVIDLKEAKKSFTLNTGIWRKVCDDAATYGWDHIPALLVSFEDGPLLITMAYDDWEAGWKKSSSS